MAAAMYVSTSAPAMQWILTRLQPRARKGSYFFTEIRAGLATFFAMAYIIAVNGTREFNKPKELR